MIRRSCSKIDLFSQRAAINSYQSDRSLDGKAFQAHKDYFAEGHLTLIGSFERAIIDMQEANQRHLSALSGLVDAYYNHNLIQADIERNLRELARWENMSCWCIYGCWCAEIARQRSRLRAEIKRLRLMLNRLNDYLARSNNIYNGMEANMEIIRRGNTRLEMQTQCREDGIVSLPTMEAVKIAELVSNPELVVALIDKIRHRPGDPEVAEKIELLADVFMALDNPEWFINLLGVKVAPGSYHLDHIRLQDMTDVERAAFLERNTVWSFDSELINALRGRVELRVAEYLENEWVARRGSSERVGSREDRLRLLPHSALLHVVSNLTPVHWEEDNEWTRLNTQHSTVLYGTADSPGISITQEAGGFLVQFAQLDKLLNMPDNQRDNMYLGNYRVREIVISEAYRSDIYRWVFHDGVREENPSHAANAINIRADAAALRNHEFDMNGSVLNIAANIAIGFVPGGGMAGKAYSLFDKYGRIQDTREDFRRVRFANIVANYVRDYYLNVVFVSENGVYQPLQLWYSPYAYGGMVQRDYLPDSGPQAPVR